MNTITTIVLVGLVLLTNVTLVLLILKSDSSRNPRQINKNQDDSEKPEVEHQVKTTETTVKVTSHAGRGKYNPSNLDEYFEEMAKKAMQKVYGVALEQFIGDVKMSQVEFGDQEKLAKETSDHQSQSDNSKSNVPPARMTKEQEAESFKDIRYSDIEDEPVSAPSASGASIDEIEESVETAMDPAATPEAKSRAGRILAKFENTNLSDIFKNDENIYNNVMLCVKESIRMETSSEVERPSLRRRRNFSVPENYDDFNPWDLIHK